MLIANILYPNFTRLYGESLNTFFNSCYTRVHFTGCEPCTSLLSLSFSLLFFLRGGEWGRR